jgi:hypothetical protein
LSFKARLAERADDKYQAASRQLLRAAADAVLHSFDVQQMPVKRRAGRALCAARGSAKRKRRAEVEMNQSDQPKDVGLRRMS